MTGRGWLLLPSGVSSWQFRACLPSYEPPVLLHFPTLTSYTPFSPSPFYIFASPGLLPQPHLFHPLCIPGLGLPSTWLFIFVVVVVFPHLLLLCFSDIFFSPPLTSTFPFFSLPTIFLLVAFCTFFLLSASFSSSSSPLNQRVVQLRIED